MLCAVAGCGRQVVRGPLGQWAHTENPGRDHHYARPASRPSVDLASGLDAGESGGPRRTPEGPDLGQALIAPAAAIVLPPTVAAVRTTFADPSSRGAGERVVALTSPAPRGDRPEPVSEGAVIGVPLSLGF